MRIEAARKRIKEASRKVSKEISDLASGDSIYAGGLAGEGYAGGFRDALLDVLLVLDGVEPNREYWRSE
jgi:hypothetical protein